MKNYRFSCAKHTLPALTNGLCVSVTGTCAGVVMASLLIINC